MPQARPKREGRAWRVLPPEEWLTRYADWRKCQPGSPKRQAFEIIKRMARRERREGNWASRV